MDNTFVAFICSFLYARYAYVYKIVIEEFEILNIFCHAMYFVQIFKEKRKRRRNIHSFPRQSSLRKGSTPKNYFENVQYENFKLVQ